MSPKRIIERAMVKKLDIIGICDHNSAENVQAAMNCAKERAVVLAGMEISTIEEVHVIALFDRTEDILKLQQTIYAHLPTEKYDGKSFGEQIICNEFDEVLGYNKRLLISATSLTLKEVIDRIHELGGLAIASHIDREVYSVIGQLGFIPEDLNVDALEISSNSSREHAVKRFPEIKKFPLITSSDAHFLQDIGKTTTSFLLEEPTIAEIQMALLNRDGRKIIL